MEVLAEIVAARVDQVHGDIARLTERFRTKPARREPRHPQRPAGAYGAASSTSSAVPFACSLRNDSLLVFSSRRRTR